MPDAQMDVPPHSRAYYEFLAGVAVGILDVLFLNPLDVVKSRLHVQGNHKVPSKDFYTGVLDAIGKIYRNEGLKAFWRGIVPALIMDPPKKGVKFLLYQQLIPFVQLGPQPTPLSHAMAGSLAGIIEAFLMNPIDVVKITQQVHQQKHLQSLAMAKYIIKHNGYGIDGLYRGITAFVARNAVSQFSYFGVYNAIKGWVPAAQYSSFELLRRSAIASFSSAVCCIVSVPFDMAKCRIQAPQPVKGVIKYRWTIQTLRIVYREEGLRAMYKGLTPLLIRAIPGGTIQIVSFEAIRDLLINRCNGK